MIVVLDRGFLRIVVEVDGFSCVIQSLSLLFSKCIQFCCSCFVWVKLFVVFACLGYRMGPICARQNDKDDGHPLYVQDSHPL